MSKLSRTAPVLVALALACAACHRDDAVDDDAERAPKRHARTRARTSEPAPSATPVAPSPSATPSSVSSTLAPAWPPPKPAGVTSITDANASAVLELWSRALGGWGKAIAASRVLDRVAASSGHEVVVFDAHTGDSVAAFAPACGEVLALGFGPSALVVACTHGIDVYDATTWKKRSSQLVRSADADAASVAWPRVALSHKDAVLARYTIGTASPQEIEIQGPPVEAHSLALSRDGKRVAIAWSQGTVWAWEWATPARPIKLAQYTSRASVAFGARGDLVLESGPSFGLALWKIDAAATPFKARVFDTSEAWTNGLAIDDAGTLAIAGTSSGYLLLGATKHAVGKTHDSIEALAVDEWFSRFVGVDREGKVRCFGIP